jgi:hypothetical protein
MVASRDIYVLVCVNGSALVLCGHDVWFLGRHSMCAIFCVLMVLVCQSIGTGTGWDTLTCSTANFRLVWDGCTRHVMGFRVVVASSV